MSQERQPYANVQRVRNRANAVDMHEVLKQEIYKQKNDSDTNFRFGLNTPPQSIQPGAPPVQVQQGPSNSNVGFEDYELHFDSLDKDSSGNLGIGEMKWSISTINNNQDIKNCIQVRMGPIFFPKIIGTTGKPDFFFYRRVYMQIVGLGSTQGVLGANGNQYHFEFEVENLNSVAVKLIPLKESFFFQRPLSSINDFTVRFMVPHGFKRVPIPNDRVSIVSVANSNPARFTIVGGDLTDILGPIGVPAAPGIAVYISGFATTDATTNNAVNTTEGNYITNIVNNSQFDIAGIDLTAIPATSGVMIVPKNRIAFPMRFTSVKEQLTNYIGVNHD